MPESKARVTTALSLFVVVCTFGSSATLAVGRANPAYGWSDRLEKRVCPTVVGAAHCDAIMVATVDGTPATSSAPSGYGPGDLRSAYRLRSATDGHGQVVALVHAYDDPNAESDLAVYRSWYGLPGCTNADGCFRKVDQSGGARYPKSDASWGREISLDLDVTSPSTTSVLPRSDGGENGPVALTEGVSA